MPTGNNVTDWLSEMQRYEAIGYYLVCSSPFVSILLLLFGAYLGYLGLAHNYLLPIMWQIGFNVSIMALEASGILLYFIGYKRKEKEDFPLLLVSGLLLILWGLLASFFIYLFYMDFLEWANQPSVRAIIVWDNLEYATWEIKGFLWIVAGLMFTVSHFRR